jgi:hypothetical protein
MNSYVNNAAGHNILDGLVAEADRWFTIRNVTLSYHVLGGADATLFVEPGDEASAHAWETPSGHRLERRSPDQIRVHLSDDQVARVGAALERGAPDALFTGDLELGQRWVINFGNPNATKALHIGHLRQLAIGHALSSMHQAAGADVGRQTRVCDFGRSIGEALAGYRAFGGDVALGSTRFKGDRFIGECYAKYVSRLAQDVDRVVPAEDTALSREGDGRDDEAERLLAQWVHGQEVEREFSALRRWVLEGHDQTMLRLGIVMRRTLLESDHLAHGQALQSRAMAKGLVQRAENGATLYETGEEGYPYLLLCRPDGFPTQHLRYIATWDAIRDDCHGARSIGVMGAEWGPMGRFTNALLRALHDEPEVHPHILAIHGMVVAGTSIVKSSDGDDSVLIDEVLDRLAASGWVDGLCQAHERVGREEVARMLALAYFLNKPLGERASLTIEELLSPRASIGCALAQAWVHTMNPAFDGDVDPDPGDPEYRTLVVRSQMHRRLLQRCLDRTEVLPLARFHFHLSRWYLLQPKSARLARAMRAILHTSCITMGLAGHRSNSAS